MRIVELIEDLIATKLKPIRIAIGGNNVAFRFKKSSILMHVRCHSTYGKFLDTKYYYDDPQFPDNMIQHIIQVIRKHSAMTQFIESADPEWLKSIGIEKGNINVHHQQNFVCDVNDHPHLDAQ